MVRNSLTAQIRAIVRRALDEDLGTGDVTSKWTLPANAILHGEFLVKANGILTGMDVAAYAFYLIDRRIELTPLVADGQPVSAGQRVAAVAGPGISILSAERTALNFLQRMSGIATMTRRYVDAAGRRAVILDTRKTAPGLRLLDKWAVRLGGGQNHRAGLYDMVLIKDNVIAAAGGITAALAGVPMPSVTRSTFPRTQMRSPSRRFVSRISMAPFSFGWKPAIPSVSNDPPAGSIPREGPGYGFASSGLSAPAATRSQARLNTQTGYALIASSTVTSVRPFARAWQINMRSNGSR